LLVRGGKGVGYGYGGGGGGGEMHFHFHQEAGGGDGGGKGFVEGVREWGEMRRSSAASLGSAVVGIARKAIGVGRVERDMEFLRQREREREREREWLIDGNIRRALW
jgi:hypothetical protein